MLSIRQVLDRFLASERTRAPGSGDATEAAVANLVSFLDGYGYQYVEEDDEEYVGEDDEAFDGDEESFVEANTPHMLPGALPEFLFEWQIRKSMGGADDARETAQVAERLMDWLVDERFVKVDVGREAAALARRAADEVPRAKRLASLIYPLTQQVPGVRPTSEDEVVEDFLRIVRVEPGQLWLEQDVGPLAVSVEASRVADVGWWIDVVASRLGGTWYLTEVGNVYPMLAVGGPEDASGPDEEDGS